MTLEEEIFKKSELDNNKLLEYGFIKKDNYELRFLQCTSYKRGLN